MIGYPPRVARIVIATKLFQGMIRMLERREIYDGKGRSWCEQEEDGVYLYFRARVK